MPDLLIEVGCEELPSTACHEIVEQAPGIVASSLAALGLEGGPLTVSVAPRRFAVHAPGLPDGTAPSAQEVRGPSVEAAFGPDGAPTKAAQGFARGQGVAVEDLVVREQQGRAFVFAERQTDGRPLDELVPEVAERLVSGLRFSKTMRWGDGTGLRFSRPVRWLVAKVNERTVPFELHGLTAGDVSQGHRFLGGPATIGSASGYDAALRAVAVVASHDDRRAQIVADLDAAATQMGGSWRDPLGVLEEVVFLVEWPSVIAGRIDQRHMELPPRVLVTAMQGHQRYFPLEDASGGLLPLFLSVSNGDPAHAEVIGRGNEDVLDARLQDAAFSFEVNREAGLAALDARLDTIVFHKRLGTMADKRERLRAGVADLAARLGVDPATAATAGQAARWAKADQGAVLVAEFSDLQGYVAAEYARREGIDAAVATAIEEQYLPLGADSPAPQTEAGALVAAAEKVDNLVGAFAVDEAPTGSKDPYGLRRAAAGLVRIALERGWDIDHDPVLEQAYARLTDQGADLSVANGDTVAAIDAFLADRLVYLLGTEGVGAEAVGAAMGAGLGSMAAAAAWARAIEAERATPRFQAAWTAATRLSRISRQAPGEDVTPAPPDDDAGETALREAIAQARAPIEAARRARDLGPALDAAEALAAAVDRFFVDVLVNADDPGVRARRYGLVREAAEVLRGVADFDRITDGGGAR